MGQMPAFANERRGGKVCWGPPLLWAAVHAGLVHTITYNLDWHNKLQPSRPLPSQNSLAQSPTFVLPRLAVVLPAGQDWQVVVAEAPPALQEPTAHCLHGEPA